MHLCTDTHFAKLWGGKYMKYMSEQLRNEYKRYCDMYADLDDLNAPLMNISDVLKAYFILVDYFSDPTADAVAEKMLVGIRDMNLMISALGRQNVSFAGKVKYHQPLDICATLFFGLVKNHAFSDGNKRTALLTLLYQLDGYGYYPCVSQKNFEKLVVAVASNQLNTAYEKVWKHVPQKYREDQSDQSVHVISSLLKKMTKRKDNAFHIDIPAIDFINAIDRIEGCSCEVDGAKIKMHREFKRKGIFARARNKSYSIPYRGDTRPIKAGTAREVLDQLELYDQYPNYASFIKGSDPRYMLIQQFEAPLRRLKDK